MVPCAATPTAPIPPHPTPAVLAGYNLATTTRAKAAQKTVLIGVSLSLDSPRLQAWGGGGREGKKRKESQSLFAEREEGAQKNCAELVILAITCLDVGLIHSYFEVLRIQNVP